MSALLYKTTGLQEEVNVRELELCKNKEET